MIREVKRTLVELDNVGREANEHQVCDTPRTCNPRVQHQECVGGEHENHCEEEDYLSPVIAQSSKVVPHCQDKRTERCECEVTCERQALWKRCKAGHLLRARLGSDNVKLRWLLGEYDWLCGHCGCSYLVGNSYGRREAGSAVA
jgi:hypothetical protein